MQTFTNHNRIAQAACVNKQSGKLKYGWRELS